MRILVLQHVAVEHPGIFRDLWSQSGFHLDQVQLDEGNQIPDLSAYDLMVVMGGPMDVWQEDLHPWLVPEKAAIRRWVKELGKPYLGVCLGHQLLAEALGGKVGPMAKPEVGLAHVDLTAEGLKDPILEGFAPVIECNGMVQKFSSCPKTQWCWHPTRRVRRKPFVGANMPTAFSTIAKSHQPRSTIGKTSPNTKPASNKPSALQRRPS